MEQLVLEGPLLTVNWTLSPIELVAWRRLGQVQIIDLKLQKYLKTLLKYYLVCRSRNSVRMVFLRFLLISFFLIDVSKKYSLESLL